MSAIAHLRPGRISPRFVVISHQGDAHAELVVKHLPQGLFEVAPVGKSMSFELGGGRSTTTYDGHRLDGVRAVWHRHPISGIGPWVEQHVAEGHRPYAKAVAGRMLRQLQSGFRDAFWISDPDAIQRAESKVLQLECAGELGFAVPHTLITSDPAEAALFRAQYPAVIVKGLLPSMSGGVTAKSFFAQLVERERKLDMRRLLLTPAIFQQPIDPVADLRITVVGSEVFAASIDSRPTAPRIGGVRDWRYRAHASGPDFKATEIPEHVRRMCVALTKALGLRYAAIDMVVDHAGRLWFLELNPNGQWGFVEVECGLPIGPAIAELLQHGAIDRQSFGLWLPPTYRRQTAADRPQPNGAVDRRIA
jgi:glutathione synthase/RimK-type ligase-like ATP-grasp enzyme